MDTSTVDSNTDGGVDSPAPACDLMKPFGKGTRLDFNQPYTREDGLWLLPDELTGFLSSDRPRDGGFDATGIGAFDLYAVTRADKQSIFALPTLLLPVSDMGIERTPVVTGDGLDLYFSVDSGLTPFAEIYHSHRNSKGDAFPAATLVANVNSPSPDWVTYISNDGQSLVQTSNRSGSAGFDFYISTLGGNGFTTPAALTALNSAQDENGFTMTPDLLTVYFGSNRTGTTGGFDIWMATRAKPTDAFSNIKNVTELNGTPLDFPSWVSADGCTLYYGNPTAGNYYDVLRATRPK